ncbi:hypothetical protein F4694_004269 [Bacillus niacini]|uniref:Uncharacterized protein n=1 Tax=Neobacillus niacini TaxID=86668 RepID=A0A852TJP7_9BACI|nr:hypothetical protein [Neobacillus niacini]
MPVNQIKPLSAHLPYINFILITNGFGKRGYSEVGTY